VTAPQGASAFDALQRGLLGDDVVEANRALAAQTRAHVERRNTLMTNRMQAVTGLLAVAFLTAIAIAPALIIAAWRLLL
jgi:hypothetical protein